MVESVRGGGSGTAIVKRSQGLGTDDWEVRMKGFGSENGMIW